MAHSASAFARFFVVNTVILAGALEGHNCILTSALIVPTRPIGIGRRQLRKNGFFYYPTDPNPVSILFATPSDDDIDNGRDESQPDGGDLSEADLDQQIIALENMLKGSSDEHDVESTTSSSILTTSRQQRLEREIELLKRLDPGHPENNEDYSELQNQELVVSELWGLWYGERGPMNERRLRAIEETLMDPDLWPDAERQYTSLIEEHCGAGKDLDLSNWVEPANRLATLLFLMGRFGESRQWCERILSAKPWHIGALSGVVMVCMKMNDKAGILKYSLMGLPNLTPQLRNARVEWVRKNVQSAENKLLRLQELNRVAFGDPDERGEKSAELDSDNENTSESMNTAESQTDDSDSPAWQ